MVPQIPEDMFVLCFWVAFLVCIFPLFWHQEMFIALCSILTY
jgi:hypothetical protein